MANALICVMVLAVLAVALLTGSAVDAAETVPAGFGHLRLMECEGHCGGLTRHETDGDTTATCTGCGTPRTTGTDGA